MVNPSKAVKTGGGESPIEPFIISRHKKTPQAIKNSRGKNSCEGGGRGLLLLVFIEPCLWGSNCIFGAIYLNFAGYNLSSDILTDTILLPTHISAFDFNYFVVFQV